MNETRLIFKKISEVMNAVGVIEKNNRNQQQGYSFRGIDDMYNALNEHLAKANIFFTSEIVEKTREEKTSKAGAQLIYTILHVRWTVSAEDGSFVLTETIGEAMDSGDKSANKAMSAAYKYALMQIFCIPTKEDKDTENQTHELAQTVQAVKTAFAQPLSPTGIQKICQTCQKPYNPKIGTEAWSKTCYACYLASKKGQVAMNPPTVVPPPQNYDAPPFN